MKMTANPMTSGEDGKAGEISTNAIAVVGMACKFPGADSLEEYWRILSEGLSLVTEAPIDRFPTRDHKRSSNKSVFFGNFLSDIASFDNRFFKKSSREAASMDPQQRLLLEVAYQALESAGYFGPHDQDTDVGCFVGACATDYTDNVASHPPNAFSALGTLKAFSTGNISHYFGFSGPSITFDTACSSSAVAIDAACKAIIHGDCTTAIAGGVSIFTSPHFFQNLAAASFLSTTGATKSFDAGADGYCRGEGIGLVVLKSLSRAVAEGDSILGTILSTSVMQSSNRVPITVPHSPSQASLYRRVLKMAGVSAADVSFLEAHGTGTPIGDPQEFEGIMEVFGGQRRQSPLYFASVKGNIGHTEGASGVAGLIKTILMMQNRAIPRQANYTRLNPKIKLQAGQFQIPTETLPWTSENLIACINNYGAAGSIAAIVVKDAAFQKPTKTRARTLFKYPLLISGNSLNTLGKNCAKLTQHISSLYTSPDINLLADIAFNLSEKQNRSLPHMFITSVSSISELNDQLLAAASIPGNLLYNLNPSPKPVVLIFGGQTSRSIGLQRHVYDESAILRKSLDKCDSILKSFGHQGIYPNIFGTTSIDDVVLLQAMQFALQYACAQSWIACGLKIDCLVGHSFGQLVALTVAGVFSLYDGLKFVYGRAVLMRDRWGIERGSMIAINSDHSITSSLISSIRKRNPASGLEVACYNGPKSHVLVGSVGEVEAVVDLIKESTVVKHKVLDVTHGFHSRFFDSILPDLKSLAESLTYQIPKIRVETCSNQESWVTVTPTLIADHSRTPVYFEDSVKRIEARLGSCTWVEAGSNSSVINMARRALSNTDSKDHLFYPITLSRDDAIGALADVTTNLWRNGHHVQFWPFHRLNRGDYKLLNLPPYQFEKTRHWLDFNLGVESAKSSEGSKQDEIFNLTPTPVLEPLLLCSSHQDNARQRVFTVDPRSDEWRFLVEGHAVLKQPLCPAPLYVELAMQAASKIAASRKLSCKPYPRVEGLEILSPLGISPHKIIKLILTQSDQAGLRWSFAFQAQPETMNDSAQFTTHASGHVEILLENGSSDSELLLIGKLLRGQNLEHIISHTDSEVIQGSLIYTIFSRAVKYQDFYRGVRHVASRESDIVAQVSLPHLQPNKIRELLSNPIAVDNFLQVPGLYANCLAPCNEDDIYICTHIDRIQFSSAYNKEEKKEWTVFATSSSVNEREASNDVFVIEKTTRKLIFVASGIRFNKVRVGSLAKVLSRINDEQKINDSIDLEPLTKLPGNKNLIPVSTTSIHRRNLASHPTQLDTRRSNPSVKTMLPTSDQYTMPERKISDISIENELREMLSKITEISASQFQGNVSLNELGIDSLMATEIVSEVDKVFNIIIPQDRLQDLQTFASLCDYLNSQWNHAVTHSIQASPRLSVPLLPYMALPDPVAASFSHSRLPMSIGESDQDEQLVSQLSILLGEHLGCPASIFERSTNLAERGLDSLLCMELMSDIEQAFGVVVDLAQLTTESSFGELSDILTSAAAPVLTSTASTYTLTSSQTPGPTNTVFPSFKIHETMPAATTSPSFAHYSTLQNAPKAFESTKTEYSRLADEYHFTGFYDNVFHRNSQLVLAYTVEAFAELGIDLARIDTGEDIPHLHTLSKHRHLCGILYEVLRDGGIVNYTGKKYVRSQTPVDPIASKTLFENIVTEFPQHSKEHILLNLCGSQLAKLLSGKKDPLAVLFGSKTSRDILEDVYSTSPMYIIMSQLLVNFLEKALLTTSPGHDGKFHIIELGAGTGSTTKWVVDRLVQRGIPIEYTFTDISPSLVSAGKRKFANYSCMKYATIDIEKEPPRQYHGQFDIVLSTNCIHATSDLVNSLSNVSKLLKPHGFVSLIECTSQLFWLDMVFGLLDGWWLFNDGRPYVLATPEFWENCLKKNGFQHVSWTGGSTRESEIVRIITGFKQGVENPELYTSIPQDRGGGVESVVFKHTENGLPLCADIYYPSPTQNTAHSSWIVALMIHGGGHVMLSRKDVRPRQTKLLLDHGLLPVSVDYRLCPEVTILNGPLIDVSDAYEWARNILPSLKLKHTSLEIVHDRTVVIGWSTGGTLAMSLAWTSIPRGLSPPEAILVFYCPTNYEDEFWQRRNIPKHSEIYSHEDFNILESIQPLPINAYNIPPKLMAAGGWMTPKDARSRLMLHMNWNAQTLPVLFRGLPSKDVVPAAQQACFSKMEQPSREDIIQASPYAQIVRGNYMSPTYIICGMEDDLIPWQQSKKTVDALRDAGVDTGITLLPGQPHLFDMYRDTDGKRWQAVIEGYSFVLRKVGKIL